MSDVHLMMPDDSGSCDVVTLKEVLDSGDSAAIPLLFERVARSERGAVFLQLDRQERRTLLAALTPEEIVGVMDCLPPELAVGVLKNMEPAAAARVIVQGGDSVVDVLLSMVDEDAFPIRDALPESLRSALARRAAFIPDTAGALMNERFVVEYASATVGEILDHLRAKAVEYSDYDVQYVYVRSDAGALVGVLRLRDMLFASPTRCVQDIMISNPATLSVDASLEETTLFFDDYAFFGAPVVNAEHVMCGVVLRKAVMEANTARANRTLLRLHGIVGGEEFRAMPLSQRSLRRLAWLGINIFLNLLAASVVALYEETLLHAISLAAFLPIISDMSGNAGNQAVAVSCRELTLRLIKPSEGLRVFAKEVFLGLANGAVLGLLMGLIAWVWKGNLWLSGVVALSLTLNTLLAGCLGGLLPLLLRKMKVDPALVSGPVLTTVTDVSGFFLALSMATLVLSHLTGT